MFLRLLVKILLPVMDLNMTYKLPKTSQNIRNSDFRKTVRTGRAKSGFRAIPSVLARHTPSSFPYLLFYYTNFDSNNLNLPSPALYTTQDRAASITRFNRGSSTLHLHLYGITTPQSALHTVQTTHRPITSLTRCSSMLPSTHVSSPSSRN